MRSICMVLFAFLCVTFLYSQNKQQYTILDKYINAHNIGSDEAISNFIEETYHADLYNSVEVEQHIEFYKSIAEEFGPLNSAIYSVDEVTPNKLIVQLIKAGEKVKNKFVDPTEILVVELELSPKDKSRLGKGLDLGAHIPQIEEH